MRDIDADSVYDMYEKDFAAYRKQAAAYHELRRAMRTAINEIQAEYTSDDAQEIAQYLLHLVKSVGVA